jgi:uncharacterized repeat protein (TIGR01451 family)
MIIRSILICLFAYSLISLPFPNLAAAQEIIPSCHPIYGGGENCTQTDSIEINKTVQNPKDSKFVENLGPNDSKYSPGQNIQFQITVKNTSGSTANNITIKDNLPRYINCDATGIGICNSSAKTITINIDTLNRNEARTIIIKGKIATPDKMQKEPDTICLINQAEATQDKKSTQDNAQFCIQNNLKPTPTQPAATNTTKGGKQVFPPSNAQTTPKTGPEMLSLASLIPLAATGFWLARRSPSKGGLRRKTK